jgi:hypothetical protein
MQFTLDLAEISEIKTATAGYNAKIKDLASTLPLAHVDMNGILAKVAKEGMVVDGVELSSTFIQGNVFSTDGIHLCPKGAAMVSYFFIESINKTFGASVPQILLTEFPAIVYP